MLKRISAMRIRQTLGQVMNEVAIRGDDYIVERAGKPIVAIIPMAKYQRLEKDWEEFWRDVKTFQESVRDVDPAELDAAIEEAVQAARKKTAKKLKSRKSR